MRTREERARAGRAFGGDTAVFPAPVRLLLVEDHRLYRQGLRMLLEAESRFQVVGEAGGAAEALALSARLAPDVILLDLLLPGLNGLALLHLLRRQMPRSGVVLLTMHPGDDYRVWALQAGAAAYCTKDLAIDQLLATIHRVAADLCGAAQPLPVGGSSDPVAALGTLAQLAPRETQVLDYVVRGLTNRTIASRLGISAHTVSNQLRALYLKLGVLDRTGAVRLAIRRGWTVPYA